MLTDRGRTGKEKTSFKGEEDRFLDQDPQARLKRCWKRERPKKTPLATRRPPGAASRRASPSIPQPPARLGQHDPGRLDPGQGLADALEALLPFRPQRGVAVLAPIAYAVAWQLTAASTWPPRPSWAPFAS